MISCRRQRDEGTGSLKSFRDSGGLRMILIGGWRILGSRGSRGDNWSHPSLKSCGEDSRPSMGVSRLTDQRQNMNVGGPLLSRKSADWRRNRDQTWNRGMRRRGGSYGSWPWVGTMGGGVTRDTELAGGTCTGPSSWCNGSGRWMEVWEHVYFASIIPPGVGTNIFRGVERRGTGGRTEPDIGIN